MILLAAPAPTVVVMIIPILGMIVISMGMVIMLTRCYVKPPAGKIMVIKKMHGMVNVTKTGSVVFPIIWSCFFVHCEVEEIELKHDDGSAESLFVCLDDHPGSAILALEKLGDKPVDEIKRLIARMLEKSDDHEETLAQIGYTIVA